MSIDDLLCFLLFISDYNYIFHANAIQHIQHI